MIEGEIMADIFKRIKDMFSDDKKIKVVVFIGLLGMGLILLSSLIPKDTNNKNAEVSDSKADMVAYDAELEEYTKEMESKLKLLLENISGVGRVEIMMNISSTKEYVYADEEKSNLSKDSENYSEQKENKYIIVESNGKKEALLKKVNNPQISGIVIVCEGGGNNVVRESIYKSVSVACDLPTSKIYVTKIK